MTYGDLIAASADFWGVASHHLPPPTLAQLYADNAPDSMCIGKTLDERMSRFEKHFNALYNVNDETNINHEPFNKVKKALRQENQFAFYKNANALLAGLGLGEDTLSTADKATLQAKIDKHQAEPGQLFGEVPEQKDDNVYVQNYPHAIAMLGVNLDHFAGDGCATRAYDAAHRMALQTAVQAGTAADPKERDLLFSKALMMNAYADHFLTDSFSAGHLRTPRALLLKPCADLNSGVADNAVPLKSAGLAANHGHDEDNYNGVEVLTPLDVKEVVAAHKDKLGSKQTLSFDDQKAMMKEFHAKIWRVVGDHKLFDQATLQQKDHGEIKQFYRVKQAVQASVDGVKLAYENAKAGTIGAKPVPDQMAKLRGILGGDAYYVALDHLPSPALAEQLVPFYHFRNSCPLFDWKRPTIKEGQAFPDVEMNVRDDNGHLFWNTDMTKESKCLHMAYNTEGWAATTQQDWDACANKKLCSYHKLVKADCPADRYRVPDANDAKHNLVLSTQIGGNALASSRFTGHWTQFVEGSSSIGATLNAAAHALGGLAYAAGATVGHAIQHGFQGLASDVSSGAHKFWNWATGN